VRWEIVGEAADITTSQDGRRLLYRLRRDGETTTVTVLIVENALTGVTDSDEVVSAVASDGRSLVESVLGEDRPPRMFTVLRDGFRRDEWSTNGS
jgi:hypothetical protein